MADPSLLSSIACAAYEESTPPRLFVGASAEPFMTWLLEAYFKKLIQEVENSDEISNAGKDKDGFYKPTRTILLRHLNLLKDLHAKPLAKPMLKASWAYVVENVPAEWLVLGESEKKELKKILE